MSDYEDSIITDADPREDGYEIRLDNSTGFFLKEEDLRGAVPKVGDVARLHTKGFSLIRGLDLNGVPVFYKSDEELDREAQARNEQYVENRKAEFEANRADLDARVAALPESFQTRIQVFRDSNPDFRWEYESYELFTCEEAIKIARFLGDRPGMDQEDEIVRQVQAFRDLDHDLQVATGLSDEHSGNTFGAALGLARVHLMDIAGINPTDVDLPLVVQWHGALTPLVGCAVYGCVHPRPTT